MIMILLLEGTVMEWFIMICEIFQIFHHDYVLTLNLNIRIHFSYNIICALYYLP